MAAPRHGHAANEVSSVENLPESASRKDEVRISPAAQRMVAEQSFFSLPENGDAHPHTVTPRAFERARENSSAREALRALLGRTPIVPLFSGMPHEPAAEPDPDEEDAVTPADPEENTTQETQNTPPEAGENPVNDPATVPVDVGDNLDDVAPNDPGDSIGENQSETDESTMIPPEPQPVTSSEPEAALSSESIPVTKGDKSTLPPHTIMVSPSGSFIRLIDTTNWR
jgi:hypothetical protein